MDAGVTDSGGQVFRSADGLEYRLAETPEVLSRVQLVFLRPVTHRRQLWYGPWMLVNSIRLSKGSRQKKRGRFRIGVSSYGP